MDARFFVHGKPGWPDADTAKGVLKSLAVVCSQSCELAFSIDLKQCLTAKTAASESLNGTGETKNENLE
jgi:hypothetical protein